jgi:hypothetical protein
MLATASLRRMFATLALISCPTAAATAQTHPLIGVTGDGASIPESLFLLDPANASATFVMTLGNGSDGETIGYNPDDGLLYHASGLLEDKVWESVDVYARTIVASGPFTGQQVTDYENTAIVYDSAGRFLVCDLFGNLFDTTLAGAATRTGAVPGTLKGLAFAGGSLYGASNSDATLYELNPSNGHELSSVAVTLNGVPVTGMNGLATDPSTGELWGIFRVGGGAGVRHLGTVDPTTGVVTSVGILPYNFAGIAFLPEPSPIFALGVGALAVALCAERRRRCHRSGS